MGEGPSQLSWWAGWGGHLLPPDRGALCLGGPFIHHPPWRGCQDDGLASSLCLEIFDILQESTHLRFQAWETHRTSPSWERCPRFSRSSNKAPADLIPAQTGSHTSLYSLSLIRP